MQIQACGITYILSEPSLDRIGRGYVAPYPAALPGRPCHCPVWLAPVPAYASLHSYRAPSLIANQHCLFHVRNSSTITLSHRMRHARAVPAARYPPPLLPPRIRRRRPSGVCCSPLVSHGKPDCEFLHLASSTYFQSHFSIAADTQMSRRTRPPGTAATARSCRPLGTLFAALSRRI